MKHITIFVFLIVVFDQHVVECLSLPGPKVYVVTPAPRSKADEGRSAPFYYHNWMRRMDPPRNETTTTTTEKVKTPDLIFAEFESGNKMKSIRQLLEKEKIEMKTSTTSTTPSPIYVPEDIMKNDFQPVYKNVKESEVKAEPDRTDYFALYNNMYNGDMAPVYMPSTTTQSTTTTTTTTSSPNVENIWHIIDSQRHDDSYSGQWEEQPISDEKANDATSENPLNDQKEENLDSNFVFPGFQTNTGMAENESRAIRTEPNLRFPYVNLKPFQMKSQKNPLFNGISNSKKGNNMFTSLDNFYEMKNPVRGEAQDVVPNRQPIDRYNPAQPYLPQPTYGSKSKQSSPSTAPVKSVASLVPPPPPPPPKVTDGNFPQPTSYESFPPYASSGPPSQPAPPPPSPPASKPSVMFQPPKDSSDDSIFDTSDSDDGPPGPPDSRYRYKPPSPPALPFVPTLPPVDKPFTGYSYDKPPMADADTSDDKPDFHGYHYSKPSSAPSDDSPPYGHDSHAYGPDYPELIYDKHHGMKDDSDMKDMSMMQPPPPQDDMKGGIDHLPSSDDHGFPHDFPTDFKFHHDFDDHDYHHHHHHHTTTTTTTEMPRVNRYSYYYLGKKLYYLPLYFSVYFIVYVGALIIKAVLRHKIVYPNSFRPNDVTATFFSKRSIDSFDLSNEKLHEITSKVTHALAVAGEKYYNQKKK